MQANFTTILKAINTAYKPKKTFLGDVAIADGKLYYICKTSTHNVPIAITHRFIQATEPVKQSFKNLLFFNVDALIYKDGKLKIYEDTIAYDFSAEPILPNENEYWENTTKTGIYNHTLIEIKRISEVYFCAAKNDNRVFLNSVCVYVDDANTVRGYAATNAHHLIASGSLPINELIKLRHLIIPRQIIDIFMKLKADFTIDINQDNQIVKFSAAIPHKNSDSDITVEIWDQLIDGKYPDISKVVKTAGNIDVGIDVAALTKLDKMAIPSDSMSVTIRTSDNTMLVDGALSCNLTIPNASYSSNNIDSININSRYLLGLIKTMKLTGTIELKALDNTHSLTWERNTCPCCGGQLPYWIKYLIMPLRK